MTGRTDFNLPLRPDNWDRKIQQMYNYWLSIHPAKGQLPSRQHFDPMDIPRLLPIVWMFDVHHNPTRFKFRLMGTEIATIVGKDAGGQWLDEAFPDLVSSGVYEDYSYVAETNKVLYRLGKPQYFVPEHKKIERLLMPLVDAENRCQILLGISVYS
ncbi:PAS domain-containing protein [Kiloniella laminariae]|uniref:PAS domain-containing protein n=1 Tax=Kiloniella laminariae TaxID=454162 RepID=A0ABT4LK54_9PROT|nr:PAS domain-containing protein [Kiloniella laminariae]MCZ4281486.1 PAS domain-containing protein [Kiloniella laminariae]